MELETESLKRTVVCRKEKTTVVNKRQQKPTVVNKRQRLDTELSVHNTGISV